MQKMPFLKHTSNSQANASELEEYQLEQGYNSIIIQLKAMEFSPFFTLPISYPHRQIPSPFFFPNSTQFSPYSYNYPFSIPRYNLYLPNPQEMPKEPNLMQTTFHNEPPSSQPYRSESSLTNKKTLKREHQIPNTAKYAKKNAESNVINQIFSFISIRQKSIRLLTRLLDGDEQLIVLYYQTMKQLKKGNKKYINRCYIKDLLQMQKDHPIHAILRKGDPSSRLSIKILQKVMRVLIIYYLKNVCVTVIITSSKLDPQSKNQHLQRRTEIEKYLQYHIRYTLSA